MAWDESQVVIVNDGVDSVFTLPRDVGGEYTPANANDEEDLPAGFGRPRGVTWDGQQLVILDYSNRRLYTLPPEYA